MAAMIRNDEEKAWMLPMLRFRSEISAGGDLSKDRSRRDFRRMDGSLTLHNGQLVHGPYAQKTREGFLRRLLEVEKLVREIGPEEVRDIPLITKDELQLIRAIWLDEKHEFEDSLPRIYEEVTGFPYEDDNISKNKYFGSFESGILREVCNDRFGEESLLPIMVHALLDIEAKASAMNERSSAFILFSRGRTCESAWEETPNSKKPRRNSSSSVVRRTAGFSPEIYGAKASPSFAAAIVL